MLVHGMGPASEHRPAGTAGGVPVLVALIVQAAVIGHGACRRRQIKLLVVAPAALLGDGASADPRLVPAVLEEKRWG